MTEAAAQAWRWSATSIAARVRSGDVSARDVVGACLGRARECEPSLNAWVEIFDDSARARADALDDRRRSGATLGPLAGVPVAIKDNLNVEGHAMSCGSRLLDGYRAPYSATVVERLLQADAVLLGRTNLDEFAMGSSGETSAFGATRNPWHTQRVPGGSSSGSASAVAAGCVPLALGSDTGGSVRQPAALCGLVGLKPTYGRLSRFGLTAHASSLDQVGPLAREVADVELALAVLSGHDPRDATSSRRAAPDIEALSPAAAAGKSSWHGLRVGLPRELPLEALSSGAAVVWSQTLERVRDLGAELVEVSVPLLPRALAIYTVIASCEASSNLARFDGLRYGAALGDEPAREAASGEGVDAYIEKARARGFGSEVQQRILLGTFALSCGHRQAYYGRARAARRALTEQLLGVLQGVDVVLTPATPSAAFRLGEKLGASLRMALCDVFTVPANLAGLPAVVVPAGLDPDEEGGASLPLGVQLIGGSFDESRLLRWARAFQDHVEWEVRPAHASDLAS